jgi:hypothetical protein
MMPIDEADLRARELALRERQITLDQDTFVSSRRASMLDWVRGLALPIASLIASLFFFLVQQQQQAFERTLTNVQDGHKFYYARLLEVRGIDPENPTAVAAGLDLDTIEKVNAAADALKSTVKIHPEVFCSAR